ncbi:MAG: HD domain-containing phosphohydrolase [Chloroflexota bacterium]
MTQKILLVDDDPLLRRAITRRQQDRFDIETAADGPEGLARLESQGPFAVVVADMRMPGMDGIQFLSLVREQTPNTVRMMLTGNADLQTAINAVNRGYIFRFLTKPCPPEYFAGAVEAGLEQYRLVMAERELLGKTLRGSIEVLSEVLSLVNPPAFSRATRIKHLMRDIVSYLKLPNLWQFELAAMLSQIGCIALPPDILNKVYEGQLLSPAEQSLYSSHPSIGRELLEKIPRLEILARMIEGQREPPPAHISPADLTSDEDVVALGAQLLNLVLTFDDLTRRGLQTDLIMTTLQRQVSLHNPYLAAVLPLIKASAVEQGFIMEVTVDELHPGMIIMQDVWSTNDILLVPRGQEITEAILIRLRRFAQRTGVIEPIRVQGAAANP